MVEVAKEERRMVPKGGARRDSLRLFNVLVGNLQSLEKEGNI
jgi:hypothetical protein